MTKFSFEDLNVYKKSRLLVKEVYTIQSVLPREEIFGLGSQIRRAAVSITANLAEGSGRTSPKDKMHFIVMSYGSLTELFSELLTACDLGYIQEEKVNEIRPLFMEVSKMLSGLRQSLQNKIDVDSGTTASASLTSNL